MTVIRRQDVSAIEQLSGKTYYNFCHIFSLPDKPLKNTVFEFCTFHNIDFTGKTVRLNQCEFVNCTFPDGEPVKVPVARTYTYD